MEVIEFLRLPETFVFSTNREGKNYQVMQTLFTLPSNLIQSIQLKHCDHLFIFDE